MQQRFEDDLKNTSIKEVLKKIRGGWYCEKNKGNGTSSGTLMGRSTILNGVPTTVFAQENANIIVDNSI